jgi:uncharacterized cupin superfamily protein
MAKIDIGAIGETNSTNYPSPFDEIVRGRFRKKLGDAGGLTQFGVNLTRLEPGSASAQRHWHENEDEFVFIVSGEAVLIEDEGETVLTAGDAATFKAGVQNGHHLVNRSDRDTVYLEIGSRALIESGDYPDIDLKFISENNVTRYTRKDGTPY